MGNIELVRKDELTAEQLKNEILAAELEKSEAEKEALSAQVPTPLADAKPTIPAKEFTVDGKRYKALVAAMHTITETVVLNNVVNDAAKMAKLIKEYPGCFKQI